MKSFMILRTGGARTSRSEFEVHATGCRDIARTLNRDPFVDAWGPIECESAEALVAAEVAVYESQDQGWSVEDHRILPCCHR